MKINYQLPRLSPPEKTVIEHLLLDEMETQRWYFVVCYEVHFGERLFCIN